VREVFNPVLRTFLGILGGVLGEAGKAQRFRPRGKSLTGCNGNRQNFWRGGGGIGRGGGGGGADVVNNLGRADRWGWENPAQKKVGKFEGGSRFKGVGDRKRRQPTHRARCLPNNELCEV